jgi:hypothetical protein
MTTKSIKPVTRETSAFVRDRGMRAIVVTIEHGILELRAKGLRSREIVDIGALYDRTVRERVMSERRQKMAERKGKKGARR